MSEDFIYKPVETVTIGREELTALQERVKELEAQLACVDEYGDYAEFQGCICAPSYKFEHWYKQRQQRAQP